MKPTASIQYLGELRTEAKHKKSGDKLITDAPLDNHGRGEAFSPTDLLATSLLSCMITVMGISAENNQIDIGDVSGEVEKVMTNAPRRVAQLNIEITFDGHHMSDTDRHLLEQIAINCPVAQSLHPNILVNVAFRYD